MHTRVRKYNEHVVCLLRHQRLLHFRSLYCTVPYCTVPYRALQVTPSEEFSINATQYSIIHIVRVLHYSEY